MEIEPLQDYLVIQEAQSIVKKSSITITDGGEMEPTNQGKVIKVSPNVKTVKEGNLVIFRNHMFDSLESLLNDKNYHGLALGKEEHVIAIIKPKK